MKPGEPHKQMKCTGLLQSFPHLSLLLQGSEAAAGRGQQRLQLQLQSVQLLDTDTIVLWATQHSSVAGAHLYMLDGLEIVIFEWRAVLQLTHDAVRQRPEYTDAEKKGQCGG